MAEKKCSRAVAHIPRANIKEFLGTIRSEPKRPQIPPLSKDGEFSERKAVDQKFFSVSGMGFGQQPLERRGATFPEGTEIQPIEMRKLRIQILAVNFGGPPDIGLEKGK